MNIILAIILLLLLNAVEYSSCDRFNIVPSPDSPCPGEFTGEPCLTLQQYVANPSLSSNITFVLHPGNHSLDSQISMQNINSFEMRANTSAMVTCNQQLREPFYFYRLQQVYVSGIAFVGCRMAMWYIINATIERNSSFVDGSYRYFCCYNGRALYSYRSSVLIRQCNISNNRVYRGAIYGSQSTFVIEQTTFSMNRNYYTCCTVQNGAVINFENGNLDIHYSTFDRNSLISANSHGGAIYTSSAVVNITGTHFSDNRAGRNGGAVYFDGSNISITNSSFINNTANSGGGGAIYSARRYTNISLVDNIFNHNTAAYCGVIEVAEFYHYHVNIIGNTFVYNRAVQQISGNNAAGVICIRNASILVIGNTFSHNSAAGDAGVIQVDESDVIIERSIFNNNTAGGNGGVLHTYFYPTSYTITNSSFINNRAGGDGGVMYVGRVGSHVTISQSTFSFNNATERGGVIAIIGSSLNINGGSIFENDAAMGEMVSACNSIVTIYNVGFHTVQDPTYSFCSLYNHGTTSVTPGIEEITTTASTEEIATTAPVEDITTTVINIVPSTGSPCPGEFTGEPCFTLEQYAAYPPSHNTPNIIFELHPGIHHLDSYLSVSNIHSFIIQPKITAATVTILCGGHISISNLQLIHVSNIAFIDCSMYLGSIVNVTVEKSSFINGTNTALSIFNSSVWIKQCTMTNNRNGAISFSGSNSLSLTIDQSLFSNNSDYSYNSGHGYSYYRAAIEINVYSYGGISSQRDGYISILNSIFEDNEDMAFYELDITMLNSTFKNNYGINFYYYNYNNYNRIVSILNSTFRENQLYFGDGQNISILDSTFENAQAHQGIDGGAISFNGGNVTVYNCNFINNTANGRGGGAILYFVSRRYSGNTIMLLINNTFSHNTAAYCGVIKMTGSYHFDANIIGNIFTYNKAIDLIPGNNGGGVICARNASVFVVDNNFSHNSAAGDAGVIQADDSQVTIERSIFSNNTAGGNGGALQTYLYPTNYTIINSSFTDNQAGGDGGAMYIGRAGSHVTIYGSAFSDNYAAERGGVIAIVGSTLQLNRVSVYENFARTGEVVNSCNSNVTVINSVVLATQDPIVSSLCASYNDSVSPMTVTTSVVPTPDPWTQERNTTGDLEDISTTDDTTDTIATTTIPQPTEENVTMTAATLPQSDDTTEGITMTTTPVPQPNDTTKDVTVMTTDSITMAKTTPHQPDHDDVTSKPATEDIRSTHTTESDSAEEMITSQVNVDDRDNHQDTAQNSLHTTVPGYVAMGVVVVLLVLGALFGVVILVKVFKVKQPPLRPPKVNHPNFSAYEYPTMKNEFALPEVHLVST